MNYLLLAQCFILGENKSISYAIDFKKHHGKIKSFSIFICITFVHSKRLYIFYYISAKPIVSKWFFFQFNSDEII